MMNTKTSVFLAVLLVSSIFVLPVFADKPECTGVYETIECKFNTLLEMINELQTSVTNQFITINNQISNLQTNITEVYLTEVYTTEYYVTEVYEYSQDVTELEQQFNSVFSTLYNEINNLKLTIENQTVETIQNTTINEFLDLLIIDIEDINKSVTVLENNITILEQAFLDLTNSLQTKLNAMTIEIGQLKAVYLELSTKLQILSTKFEVFKMNINNHLTIIDSQLSVQGDDISIMVDKYNELSEELVKTQKVAIVAFCIGLFGCLLAIATFIFALIKTKEKSQMSTIIDKPTEGGENKE